MELDSISQEGLQEIGIMVKNYLEGNLNTNSIYNYVSFTTFSQYSNVLHQTVGFSYYPESKRFGGNVNGIGDFYGTVNDNSITVNCSRSSNSAFITLS